MRTLSRYDDFDRDAARHAEALVVNVSPHVCRFEIGTTPGAAPRRYKLAPGESVSIQSGYAKEFTGASRNPVRPIIESLTEREVYPRGPSLPQVVHAEKADAVREQWAEIAQRAHVAPAPVKVMVPRADGGDPIEMTVQPPAPVDAVPMRRVIEDDEDQAGPLDEPPPDHNEPEPPTIGGKA